MTNGSGTAAPEDHASKTMRVHPQTPRVLFLDSLAFRGRPVRADGKAGEAGSVRDGKAGPLMGRAVPGGRSGAADPR